MSGYKQNCEAGCDCFANDTMITMAYGSQRRISDMRPGDKVACADGEVVSVEDIMVGYESMLIHIELAGGQKLRVTGEHPLYKHDGQWVRANGLHVGDMLVLADGGHGKVISVEMTEYNDTVYNLIVGLTGHKLLANGIVAGDYAMQMEQDL